jgi:threonine dehydrogenase-like Zn-dependent dehydrogenase
MSKRVAVTKKGEIEIINYEVPQIDSDLLEIKTLLCTIKHGTQFRAFKGNSLDYTEPFDKGMLLHLPGSKKPSFPYIFGDVGIGIVEKVGPDCTNIKVGDIVWGYMKLQEINVISEASIYKMKNYSENFLLFDPAVVALGAVKMSKLSIGDNSLIIGLGAIGQIAARIAAIQSNNIPFTSDPNELRREIVYRGCKAKHFNSKKCDLGFEIKKITDKKGVDVVIDTSGRYSGLRDAIRSTIFGGTIISVGYYEGSKDEFNLSGEWHRNRLTLKGWREFSLPYEDSGRWDLDRLRKSTIKLLEDDKIDFSGILSDPIDFYKSRDSIYDIIEHSNKGIKLLFKFAE